MNKLGFYFTEDWKEIFIRGIAWNGELIGQLVWKGPGVQLKMKHEGLRLKKVWKRSELPATHDGKLVIDALEAEADKIIYKTYAHLFDESPLDPEVEVEPPAVAHDDVPKGLPVDRAPESNMPVPVIPKRNFMTYANETQSNIVPKEDLESLIHEVFNVLADSMARSLGPLGSSCTILNGSLKEATKDGHTIFMNHRFKNRYKTMIYNLIQTPCIQLNNTVGDGTTTAIVMTNMLFNIYREHKNIISKYARLPRRFTKEWDRAISDVVELIESYATPIDPSDFESMYNLCNVVSNGDHEVSTSIANVYRESTTPTIKLKPSPTTKSYIEAISGFDFPADLIDQIYVRNEDMSVDIKNAKVMIFDHTITTDMFHTMIAPVSARLASTNTRLIIVASSYDDYMMKEDFPSYLKVASYSGKDIPIVLTKYKGRPDEFHVEDLATILGTNVITPRVSKKLCDTLSAMKVNDGDISQVVEVMFDGKDAQAIIDESEDTMADYMVFHNIVGESQDAMLSFENGSVFKNPIITESKVYQNKLQEVQMDIDTMMKNTAYENKQYSVKLNTKQSRLSRLMMKTYIYYVGADSELQRNILNDSIEDVIKCCRSATKHGVVPGSQLSIIKACNHILLQEYGDKERQYTDEEYLRYVILIMISDAATSTYFKVLTGPDGLGIMHTIDGWYEIVASRDEEAIASLMQQSKDKAVDIVRESFEKNMVFDMDRLVFNPEIITSVETDVQVLLASSELIKVLISGNQCLVVDAVDNGAHEEIIYNS